VTDGPARTVFLGSGAFGEPSLRRLATLPLIELVGVVSAPPRSAGRHGARRPTPIHHVADELGLQVMTPDRLRAPGSVAEVLARRPDLLVLADYGQIVPTALLELRHGALNLHPSLLPRHRGASPIPATILAGDVRTGVTLMRMDEGLDTGPIVAVAPLQLRGTEKTPEVEAILAASAAELLSSMLAPWLSGERGATPQPAAGATLTRPLRREDGRLDPTRSAVDLERQVRAFQPWPGSFVETPVGRLIVWAATPERAPDAPAVGVFDAGGLGVGSGERLRLTEVQPAGGARMSWEAFLRGRPSIAGASIVGS
jgi:methionyl-tRNA formyltransferase